MKLLGPTQQTILTRRGIFTLRLEAFQDDRFRFMAICRNPDGRDVRFIPIRFRKGTKTVDTEKEIWADIEKSFRSALDLEDK